LTLLSYDSIGSIVVTCEEGYVYKLSIGDGWAMDKDEILDAFDEAIVDFQDRYLGLLRSGEWTSEEYYYRLSLEIVLQLSRRFEWKYEGVVLE